MYYEQATLHQLKRTYQRIQRDRNLLISVSKRVVHTDTIPILYRLTEITHRMSSHEHPLSDGLAERMVQTMKGGLIKQFVRWGGGTMGRASTLRCNGLSHV